MLYFGILSALLFVARLCASFVLLFLLVSSSYSIDRKSIKEKRWALKKEGRKKKKDQNVIFHQKTKPDDETYKSGVHNERPL